ncbi:MAG: hypothetical protein ACYDAL_17705, partial [Candidatus Dormibacteraceae bacterium]
FWSWFSIKREPKPALRILGLAFWAVPAIGITAAYFVTGRTIDYPRLRLVRQVSAVVQVALAMRSFSSAVTRVTVRPTASAGH